MAPASRRRLTDFVAKTFELVNKPEYDEWVRWVDDARNVSFVIFGPNEAFAEKVLPLFFDHTNWSSFYRQLNMYSFKKVPCPKGEPEEGWYFYHEFFHRDTDNLHNIRRRKATTKRDRSASPRRGKAGSPSPVVTRHGNTLKPDSHMMVATARENSTDRFRTTESKSLNLPGMCISVPHASHLPLLGHNTGELPHPARTLTHESVLLRTEAMLRHCMDLALTHPARLQMVARHAVDPDAGFQLLKETQGPSVSAFLYRTEAALLATAGGEMAAFPQMAAIAPTAVPAAASMFGGVGGPAMGLGGMPPSTGLGGMPPSRRIPQVTVDAHHGHGHPGAGAGGSTGLSSFFRPLTDGIGGVMGAPSAPQLPSITIHQPPTPGRNNGMNAPMVTVSTYGSADIQQQVTDYTNGGIGMPVVGGNMGLGGIGGVGVGEVHSGGRKNGGTVSPPLEHLAPSTLDVDALSPGHTAASPLSGSPSPFDMNNGDVFGGADQQPIMPRRNRSNSGMSLRDISPRPQDID